MVKRMFLAGISLVLLAILAPSLVQAIPIFSAPFVTVDMGDAFLVPVSFPDSTDLNLRELYHP